MKAPPIPWTIRNPMRYMAPARPVIQSTLNRIEAMVNIRNPRLYSRTRPYMSPRRPKLTTRTLVTTR